MYNSPPYKRYTDHEDGADNMQCENVVYAFYNGYATVMSEIFVGHLHILGAKLNVQLNVVVLLKCVSVLQISI